jgi:hypothetical protein
MNKTEIEIGSWDFNLCPGLGTAVVPDLRTTGRSSAMAQQVCGTARSSPNAKEREGCRLDSEVK